MRNLHQDGGQDLRHYLRLVWRRRWWLLSVLLVIPAAVYLVSTQVSKTYQSSTTLYVQATAFPTGTPTSGSFYTSSIEVVARLMRTTAVGRRAAQQLGEPPANAGELLGAIEVNAETDEETDVAQFLTITASSASPQRAADVANAFARAVTNARYAETEEQINAAIRNLREQEAEASGPEGAVTRAQLTAQIQQLDALRATQRSSTRVVEPARPSSTPISPKPRENAAVAFAFAILLAAGLVPLFDRLDRRIRDAEELEPLLGAPVLVLIPEGAFPGSPSRSSSEVREAFQTLRASLTSFNVDRSLETVIITSTTHGEGKTTVAGNLAVALAQDERDVILIDGDLRRPQMLSRFGAGKGPGLDSVLLGERSVDDVLLEVEVEVEGGGSLRLLPGGTGAPNPAVLLGSERMRSLLAELSARADMVLIDTPPILSVSDAIPLLDHVSGTVLVARLDYTSRDALRRTAQVISSAGGSLLGLVATGTRGAGLYGYDDYAYEHPRGWRERLEAVNGGGSRELLRGFWRRRGKSGDVAGVRPAANGNRYAEQPPAAVDEKPGERD